VPVGVEEPVAPADVDVDGWVEVWAPAGLVVDEPESVPASVDADDSDVDELDSVGLAQATP
jgi:hypothetical protein